MTRSRPGSRLNLNSKGKDMLIKPAPGRKVRYPDSERFLPESGAKVPDRDLFWRKRIKQGDVIVVTPKPKKGSES